MIWRNLAYVGKYNALLVYTITGPMGLLFFIVWLDAFIFCFIYHVSMKERIFRLFVDSVK